MKERKKICCEVKLQLSVCMSQMREVCEWETGEGEVCVCVYVRKRAREVGDVCVCI